MLNPAQIAVFMSNFSNNPDPQYGRGPASYLAAGEEAGLRKLCSDFYRIMSTLPEAKIIHDMHKDDIETRKDKLTLFLCGWLGGPKKYSEKYGPIHIPSAHQHLAIREKERDAWLLCMDKAIAGQNYPEAFKKYLSRQLRVPAERIFQTIRRNSAESS